MSSNPEDLRAGRMHYRATNDTDVDATCRSECQFDSDTRRTARTVTARTAFSVSTMQSDTSFRSRSTFGEGYDEQVRNSMRRQIVGSEVYFDDIKNCISSTGMANPKVILDSEEEEIIETRCNVGEKKRYEKKKTVQKKKKKRTKTMMDSTVEPRTRTKEDKKNKNDHIPKNDNERIENLKKNKRVIEDKVMRKSKKLVVSDDGNKQNYEPTIEWCAIKKKPPQQLLPDNLRFEKERRGKILSQEITSAQVRTAEVKGCRALKSNTKPTQSMLKSAPMTTQSIRRSTCYFSALQSYGFIERTTMKAERIEAFFFNNGMTITLGILYFALNVIVASYAAYQFTPMGGFKTEDEILRVTLPIARAGGRLVTLNCALLLLTACKYLWTLIRTYVVPIVPIGFPIDDIMPKYHRVVALTIIVAGCIIHTLPQIVNYATGAIWALTNEDEKIFFTFGDGLATKQLLVTGIILVVVFAAFFFTTLKAFRQTSAGFRWFWLFHMGGIALAYPLLIVHGTYEGSPVFLYGASMPLILYLFDATMRRTKITTANVLEWKTHPGDGGDPITELIIECPHNFTHTPGQYVELKFNAISSHEWHPFTIASAQGNDIRVYDGKPTKVIVFFIMANGRWTKALYNYASAFSLKKAIELPKIAIRGPHGAPIVNFFEYKHIIVIGSGVGVTPLLSVWQYLVEQGRSKIVDMYEEPAYKPSYETVSEDTSSKLGSICSKIENALESLTASICLLCLFVAGETMVAVTFIFRCFNVACWMGILLASISLTFHTGTIVVSMLAFGGGTAYFCLFKCWIEVCIILVDALNSWLSLGAILSLNAEVEDVNEAISYQVILGGITVLLHAVRTFHIFYTTLKPRREKRALQNHLCSVQGIFINRSYTSMRFCFEQLLLRPVEDGLSKAFSLRFYGTREQRTKESMKTLKRGVRSSMKNLDETRHSIRSSLDNPLDTLKPSANLEGILPSRPSMESLLYGSSVDSSVRTFESSWRSVTKGFDGSTEHTRGERISRNYFCFNEGRPDFESIFRKSILKAHFSCPDGETVGVFFCGSPAISKCLVVTADKVSAEHRYSMKKLRGKTCNCKIVVHIENY